LVLGSDPARHDNSEIMAYQSHRFDVNRFFAEAGIGKRILFLVKGQAIYAQGDGCDGVFYVQQGTVKLAVVSEQGKEATIAILSAGDFVGEECVSTSQPFYSATSTALTDCALLRIQRNEMLRVLREEPDVSSMFVSYILARTSRIQADLIDQLFNSSEKRLARTLLLLANFGKKGATETVVPQISQETLAAMIGCTRSRVNFFLNRFRKLGFIEYDHQIRVNKSLLQVVLHD
jgi:CRP/FNR family cyclic AMP-dependent transcriptional regulator